MNYDEIRKAVKEKISENRFKHVLGVVETAKMLANLYNEDIEKAKIASVLHDIAREYTIDEMERLCSYYGYKLEDNIVKDPALLHSKIGAILAKDVYGICDCDILNAINYHTTGRRNYVFFHFQEENKIKQIRDLCLGKNFRYDSWH